MQQIMTMNQLPLKTLALAGLMTLGCGSTWASTTCVFPTPSASFTITNPLDIAPGDPSLRQAVGFTNTSCKKRNINIYGTFCLKMGIGSAGTPAGSAYAPRWLQKGADYAGFQIYKDAGYSDVWGANATAPNMNRKEELSMVGSTVFADWTITEINGKSFPLYVELLASFPTVNGASSIAMLAPGVYTSTFGGGEGTGFGWRAAYGGASGGYPGCTGGSDNSNFQVIGGTVSANIAAQCKIKGTVADIDFGTQSGTATNLQGSTALTVQCTRTTPYYIGLLPGNGNTAGAGVMYGQAPLTAADTVAYQLRQAAGMSGTIWGNTATSISVGNGVAGTGTGSDQNHTIYATMASANAPAGSYQDLVTVTVNY